MGVGGTSGVLVGVIVGVRVGGTGFVGVAVAVRVGGRAVPVNVTVGDGVRATSPYGTSVRRTIAAPVITGPNIARCGVVRPEGSGRCSIRHRWGSPASPPGEHRSAQLIVTTARPATVPAAAGEVLHYRWRLQGLLGGVAGLFLPRQGEATLCQRPLESGESLACRMAFLAVSSVSRGPPAAESVCGRAIGCWRN